MTAPRRRSESGPASVNCASNLDSRAASVDSEGGLVTLGTLRVSPAGLRVAGPGVSEASSRSPSSHGHGCGTVTVLSRASNHPLASLVRVTSTGKFT